MSKSGKNGVKPVSLTTPTAASRVQKAVALRTGGNVPEGSVVGRMQRAAVRNYGKSGSK